MSTVSDASTSKKVISHEISVHLPIKAFVAVSRTAMTEIQTALVSQRNDIPSLTPDEDRNFGGFLNLDFIFENGDVT